MPIRTAVTSVPPARRIDPALWPARYDSLDAWRGIAALIVVIHHQFDFDWRFGARGVMLFFVISGYCIAAAVDSTRRRGLGFGGFMWRRVKRIYPPYLFALLFFVVTRFIKVALHSGDLGELPHTWLPWLQNVTLTQWTSLLRNPAPLAFINPVNLVGPSWSLQYEEQFYLIMALMLPLALRFRVLGIATLMAVGLPWSILLPTTYRGLFIEFWFHFGIGALVYLRLCRLESIAARRIVDAVIAACAIIFGLLLLRDHAVITATARIHDNLGVVSLFAACLLITRRFDGLTRQFWMKPLMWLGHISYSLYLLHFMNLALARTIAGKLVPDHFQTANQVAQILVQIALATVFWFFCERPFLNRPLQPAIAKTSEPSNQPALGIRPNL